MISVPFVKYTSFGNNFVIVDETRQQILTELQKSSFAYQATNICFGIGCDNLLVIQKYSPEIFEQINADRNYFSNLSTDYDADYIFRMFEPNGEEAFSCGNGLMSIARYLQEQYGIMEGRILTEIPTGNPRQITIGADLNRGTSWANMGVPSSVSADMVNPEILQQEATGLDRIQPLEIQFRAHDLKPFSQKSSMTLWGYLVFTGEPHLVVFPETGFSIPELSLLPFISPTTDTQNTTNAEKRYNYGTWLVKQIGCHINNHYREFFPQGINVNFARVVPTDSKVLEYRCFERGINRETLACGTGALAVSYAARKLAMIEEDIITVWPGRCRWYQPDAEIRVTKNGAQWCLEGKPQKLLSGLFSYDYPGIKPMIFDERSQ